VDELFAAHDDPQDWDLPDWLFDDEGKMIREIMFPMEWANGCSLSPDGSTLYVAETATEYWERVWEEKPAYSLN